MLTRLFTLICGVILLQLSNATGAEDFDVMVMRGSTLVRITGDESGTISEVTIREDPTPPAPEIVWETPDVQTQPVELVIQIFRDAPLATHGWGFGRANSKFARRGKPHHGFHRPMTRGKRNPTAVFGHGLGWSGFGAP